MCCGESIVRDQQCRRLDVEQVNAAPIAHRCAGGWNTSGTANHSACQLPGRVRVRAVWHGDEQPGTPAAAMARIASIDFAACGAVLQREL
jgi:hypothetical protein